MNSIKDQKNPGKAGAIWTQEEDEQLNKLYVVDKRDVMQIYQIFDRPPGEIMSRLCALEITPYFSSARGYKEYTNSEWLMYAYRAEENKKNNLS